MASGRLRNSWKPCRTLLCGEMQPLDALLLHPAPSGNSGKCSVMHCPAAVSATVMQLCSKRSPMCQKGQCKLK